VAVAALEPEFYAVLIGRLGLDPDGLPEQYDRERWPQLRQAFAEVFITRSSAEWEEVFAGSDACVVPVLSLAETPDHPHHRARSGFQTVAGDQMPAPAPRFERSVAAEIGSVPTVGAHTDEVLEGLGFAAAEITRLRERGTVA
jgi:alpha-methylacyl-CoA racemase